MDLLSLKETIEGQIRHVYPDAIVIMNVVGGEANFPIASLGLCMPEFKAGVIVTGRNQLTDILVVCESNVKYRFEDVNGQRRATWYLRSGLPEYKLPIDMLKQSKGVLVVYGPAGDGGELWFESTGNERKGSYRRLAYTKDLKQLRTNLFDEIDTTFTEHNLELFYKDLLLENKSDYAVC